MNPTELKVEQVLNGVDDDLKPTPTPDPPTPPTDVTPPTADNQVPPADPPKPGDVIVPEADLKDVPGGDKTDEGFTADDVADKKNPKEDKPTDKPTEPPQNLDPETQYIVDKLPDITTTILVDGKPQEVSVKSWTQLPQDVEFASKRDELAFMNALTAQESRAKELQTEYRTNQNQAQVTDFEQREATGIRSDITKLQTEDLLPKFKLQPDQPGFEDDPGTKEVQKVLDFMNKRNQDYLETYNKGGPYKHIGFEEAYYMLPDTQKKTAQEQAQKAEDEERHNKAGNVSTPTGLSNLNIKKPSVPRGTTMQQIADYYENTL